MKKILLLILPLVVGCRESSHAAYPRSWVYWLQEADPSQLSAMTFDLVVMDYSRDGTEDGEYTRQETYKMTRSGKIVLAYLSIGEAESYRFYWEEGWDESPPDWLGEENPQWDGNYVVKYWNRGWKAVVMRYLRRIVRSGFSGVYLDKIDSYEYWADSLGTEEAALRMADLIREVSDSCKTWAGGNCVVVPQNGIGILRYAPTLVEYVDGWSLEDILYSEGASEALDLAHRLKESGKFILSVEYIYNGDVYDVERYYRWAAEEGFLPYASDTSRALDHPVIIPGMQPGN